MSNNYNLTVTAHDVVTGSVISQRKVHNTVTLTARNLIRDFLNSGTTNTGIRFIGVGSDTGAASTTQTALGTELQRSYTVRRATSEGLLVLYGYMGSGDANGSSLSEVGLFDASTQGNMFARAVYTPIPKSSSNCVTFAWELSITANT